MDRLGAISILSEAIGALSRQNKQTLDSGIALLINDLNTLRAQFQKEHAEAHREDSFTVYIVFADMEDDEPSAYVCDEDVAKLLKDASDGAGDYTETRVSYDEWMCLLVKSLR